MQTAELTLTPRELISLKIAVFREAEHTAAILGLSGITQLSSQPEGTHGHQLFKIHSDIEMAMGRLEYSSTKAGGARKN